MVKIDSPWVTSYLTSIDCSIASVTVFFKYLTSNFDDLELGRFNVIQGQRSWYQLIAQGRFCIGLPLTPSWYLSPFEICDHKAFIP